MTDVAKIKIWTITDKNSTNFVHQTTHKKVCFKSTSAVLARILHYDTFVPSILGWIQLFYAFLPNNKFTWKSSLLSWKSKSTFEQSLDYRQLVCNSNLHQSSTWSLHNLHHWQNPNTPDWWSDIWKLWKAEP